MPYRLEMCSSTQRQWSRAGFEPLFPPESNHLHKQSHQFQRNDTETVSFNLILLLSLFPHVLPSRKPKWIRQYEQPNLNNLETGFSICSAVGNARIVQRLWLRITAPERPQDTQFLSLTLPLACQMTLKKPLCFLSLQFFSLWKRSIKCHLSLGEKPCHQAIDQTDVPTGKHNSKLLTATPSHCYAEPQTPRTILKSPLICVKPSYYSAAVAIILPSVEVSSPTFFSHPPNSLASSETINCSFLEWFPYPCAHPQLCH